MELSDETLEHLRNEALVGLCREKIAAELAALERQLEELQSTRSPFAVFSRREAREAFTRSVRASETAKNTLEHYLAQLQQVEVRMLPLIRADIEAYLENVSPDFQQVYRSLRMLDVWQRKLRELADPLLGFAREVRLLRTTAPGPQMLRAIAATREIVGHLEAGHATLSAIARDVASALAAAGSAARLPDVPELRRLAWVQRLAILSGQQIVVESTLVEKETRSFLAHGLEAACARAQECRAPCQKLVDQLLDQYWTQLRAYAREHYIDAFDLGEAVGALTVGYVDADIQRYQRELAVDPFLAKM